ncbi:MAG: cytidylate kinase-like family protein [Candidatus Accumulibacter sp.]|jgi:cytidylate kinase|nr:cytidylate kinase-like family protein [Accumulibacter sp.]
MNGKFTLTIARQYGSGGFLIGKKLADDLKVPFYDKELLRIAAKKSGFKEDFINDNDEKPKFFLFLGNVAEQISSTLSFDDAGTENTSHSLFKIQSDVIRGLARKSSAIFVGRCADYVLREYRNLVSVFISADVEDRIRRVSGELNIGRETARAALETVDRQRARYYRHYTGKEWGAASSYHLCVNSSRLGLEATAEFIGHFIEKRLAAPAGYCTAASTAAVAASTGKN